MNFRAPGWCLKANVCSVRAVVHTLLPDSYLSRLLNYVRFSCAYIMCNTYKCVQVKNLQGPMFAAVQSCRLDCVLLVPLIRLLSLFSLKLGCQPASCNGAHWQICVFDRCQASIVACLEKLDSVADDPSSVHKSVCLAAEACCD
jgi:hypothetical protein